MAKENMVESLDGLQGILARLGPGLFLTLDHAAFSQFFGGEIENQQALGRATQFVEANGCFILSEKSTIKVGRAYFSKIE